MKAVAILFVAALAVASAIHPLKDAEYEFLFTKWANQHTKSYESTEFLHRFMVWKSNLDYIRSHNAKNETYTLAMNRFGDLTNEEFRDQYVGYNGVQRPYLRSKNTKVFNTVNLPSSVDWVAEGKVNPIKDQGQCGSCWAFSAVASIESAYVIENSGAELISLAEQQLVDCSTSYGNQGCNGGLMDQAFEYAEKTPLVPESDYPYKAQDGTCNSGVVSKDGALKVTGYTDVTPNDENQLQAAVAQQVVSVAVEADGLNWQFYSSGIMSGTCGTNLDHGVAAVGYGVDSTNKAYWKVRNSWGSSWGMQGYVLLQRSAESGKPGYCGIAMDPSFPTGVTKA